jgi:hypothetical protein
VGLCDDVAVFVTANRPLVQGLFQPRAEWLDSKHVGCADCVETNVSGGEYWLFAYKRASEFYLNRLTGTIPSQLGRLTLLTSL